jgi:two-component system, chemotaxis family, protein-glutamate methylesterase/glutaminase
MSAPERHPESVGTANRYGIVAIGSSAGGVQALSAVLGALPTAFPVPLVVVQHLDPRHETILAEILSRRSALRVGLATSGVRMSSGSVYIAPPNRHLLVGAGGVLSLTDSERTHFVRPSADRLFESVAEAYGPRAIACVLTGTGRDGASGVLAVKAAGGTVVVEDPATAEFAGMPGAAVGTGAVDVIVPLGEVAARLGALMEARKA